MRSFLFRASLASSIVFSGPLFAWGERGHQLLNEVAASTVSNKNARVFLEKYLKPIQRFANTPDKTWKNGEYKKQERSLHWFQMDEYTKSEFKNAIVGYSYQNALRFLTTEYVDKNGSAMWRISSLHAKMITAIKNKDYQTIIQLAGVMGRYVGDMAQPMHASSDYDGQSIKMPGIHKLYETTLVNAVNFNSLMTAVVKNAGVRRTAWDKEVGNNIDKFDVQNTIWEEALESEKHLAKILLLFKGQNKNERKLLEEDFERRVGEGAAILSKLWDVAFAAAGADSIPADHTAVAVAEPKWIDMDGVVIH